MKIALVISVSSYDQQQALPACDHDSAAIRSIVHETGRFDEVVVISGNAPAAATKGRIKELVKTATQSEVEEFFLYFSGHGCVVDNDFRYVLSDFDEAQPNATAISNAELDGWARALNPQLFVKIVDACNSGVQYIKDTSLLPKTVERAKEQFKNCYFLFSSLDSQASFAAEDLSDFTKAIVESVVQHKADSIGYSDLANAVADRFRTRRDQTPFFVQQATLTEEFVAITEELRRKLKNMLSQGTALEANEAEAGNQETSSLRARVLADAESCITEKEALAFLDAVRSRAGDAAFSGDLAELYAVKTEEIPHSSVDRGPAALWLSKRPASEFFVEIDYDVYYTDMMGNRLSGNSLAEYRRMGAIGLSVLGQREHRDVRSYSLRERASWEALRVIATPALPNLPKWQLDITYAIGPRRVAIFYAPVSLGRTGWDEYKDQSGVKWTVHEANRAEMKTAAHIKFGEVLAMAISASLESAFLTDSEKKAL